MDPHDVGDDVPTSLLADTPATGSPPLRPGLLAGHPTDDPDFDPGEDQLSGPIVDPSVPPDVDREAATRELTEILEDEPEVSAASADKPTYKEVRVSRLFGRFELLLEMARGGMATVYLARIRGPERFQKLLAIKKIHEHLADEERFIQMFLDEARLAAQIHHPNVVTLFEMGEIEERHFLAMEYVHGQSVSDLLRAVARRNRHLPWSHTAKIISQAAAGLHAAHELCNADGTPLNVVHRDVSPQNLLLSYDGHVKVVDFGIAYAAERMVHTRTGTLKGKIAYMSPEQARQQPIDRRSDIFSLGIVLYEMVCMRRLFRRESDIATLKSVSEARIPRPRAIRPDIPAGLERIILRALARDPDRRYPAAEQLSDDLEALLVSENAVVTTRRLSRLMKHVFYEKKKSKDRQIQLALQARAPEPMIGIGMDASGSAIEAPDIPSSLVPTRSRLLRPVLVIVGAILALGAAVIVGYLMSRRDPSPSSESPSKTMGRATAAAPDAGPAALEPPRPMTAPMPPPQPRRVTLQVRVLPKKAAAEVVFEGRSFPGNRFKKEVDRSTEPVTLEIRAPGFHSETLEMTPTTSITRTVRLKPRPRRRRPWPRYGRRPGRRPPMRAMGLIREPMW